jgi:hypothetical protein
MYGDQRNRTAPRVPLNPRFGLRAAANLELSYRVPRDAPSSLCSKTSGNRCSEDEPPRCIEPCRPTFVLKKRPQLVGLVEDLDDLVLASVV